MQSPFGPGHPRSHHRRASNPGPPPPPPSNWPVGLRSQIGQIVPPGHNNEPVEPPTLIYDPRGPPVIVNLPWQTKSRSRSTRSEPPKGGVLAWMAGTSRKKSSGKRRQYESSGGSLLVSGEPKTSRPTSSMEEEEKRRRRAFLQQDPLNVHQTILKHLQGSARAPITSVYGLAKLITSSCADVFDPYKIPPDFQFFDFFERSIGAVVSNFNPPEENKISNCCRLIKKLVASRSLRALLILPSTLIRSPTPLSA
jgi:hypothetical protein